MNPKMALLHEAFASALCVTNTLWQNREAMKPCVSDNLSCSETETRFLRRVDWIKIPVNLLILKLYLLHI